MIFEDKNQTLHPPIGYEPYAFDAHGAYLRLEYHKDIFQEATTNLIGQHVVVIFLNDQGREVMRSREYRDYSVLLTAVENWSNIHPDHVQASNKFWATIKSRIRRIHKCLKK